MKEKQVTKSEGVKVSGKPVMVMVSGSVVVRCNRCGLLLCDMFKVNGGTVECTHCGNKYLYQVKLKAKQVPVSGHNTRNSDSVHIVVHKETDDER